MSGGTVVLGFTSSAFTSSNPLSFTVRGETYTANANNPTNGVYYYTKTGVTQLGYINIFELTAGVATTLVSVSVTNGVTSIRVYAFFGCTNLASFTFIDVDNITTLTTFGNGAFQNCTSLTSFTFPKSVTTIGAGNYVFYNCRSLTTLYFLQPSNITTMIDIQTAFVGLIAETIGYSALTTVYYYSKHTNVYNYLPYTGLTFILYDIPCFLEGSNILTNNGYVKIETLRKGDLLQTALHGYKPIDMIGWKEIDHLALDDRNKDQLYKCTPENYPELLEDLVLTGCHSILVDDFKNEEERENSIKVNGDLYITGNKYRLPACVDERALVYETKGHYKVYHVALENEYYYKNYGIYANGLLVESCSKRYLKELSGMELL